MKATSSYRKLNNKWLKIGEHYYLDFLKNRFHMENRQKKMISDILRTTADTAYGRKQGIHAAMGYSAFSRKVDITEEYTQLEGYIESILLGKPKVLTSEEVLFCETTSGTSGFEKIIPYTHSMRSKVEAGIFIWLNALKRLFPAAFSGPSFWSLSPLLKTPYVSSGGIRVGIASDAELLHERNHSYISDLVIQPSTETSYRDTEEFYHNILTHLLCEAELSFISIWSPTYLLQLDKILRNRRFELLEAATLSSDRRDYLNNVLNGNFTWKQIWPNLSLLSCWKDAQASLWCHDLKRIGGNIKIQGKGLVSTEGISSIPIDEDRPVLAYTCHFFEFRDTETTEVLPSWEVEKNRSYELILTNGSGLVRYATGDMVRITGSFGTVPRIQFLGRSSSTSDLVGEKVSEAMLITAFNSAVQLLPDIQQFIKVIFQPQMISGSVQYVMHLENLDHSCLDTLRSAVEKELCRNPYYAQALRLGQLKPLRTSLHPGGTIEKMMDAVRANSNVRDGDFKEKILINNNLLENP